MQTSYLRIMVICPQSGYIIKQLSLFLPMGVCLQPQRGLQEQGGEYHNQKNGTKISNLCNCSTLEGRSEIVCLEYQLDLNSFDRIDEKGQKIRTNQLGRADCIHQTQQIIQSLNAWTLKKAQNFNEYIIMPNSIRASLKDDRAEVNLIYDQMADHSTLSQQIMGRSQHLSQSGKQDAFYSEAELWYLLYALIQSANNIRWNLLCFNPSIVHIESQGNIKVLFIPDFEQLQLDQFLAVNQNVPLKWHGKLLKIQVQTIGSQKIVIPQLNTQDDNYKIGMTVLMAGNLLTDQSNLNREGLTKNLQIFGSRYSSYLYSTLHSLIAYNPEHRKSILQIHCSLQPYEHEIKSLQSFLPSNRTNLNYRMASKR